MYSYRWEYFDFTMKASGSNICDTEIDILSVLALCLPFRDMVARSFGF